MFLLLVLVATATASNDQLDYDNQDQWYTDCLTGNIQSPINVLSPRHFKKVGAGPLVALPTAAQSAEMINEDNLNTVKFAVTPAMKAPVKGLRGVEVDIVQLHIHWGRDDEEGSEHWLDGEQYSAECHLVTSYTGADGDASYVVFARLFEIGEENPQVAQMIAAANPNSASRDISSFDLTALYPTSIERIITYEGSFTTPNCDERAYWVIVPEPLEISSEQLETLRQLPLGDGTGHHMEYNFRDLQHRNGRRMTGYSLRNRAHIRYE